MLLFKSMDVLKTHIRVNTLFRWLLVFLCLVAIAHFSNQTFHVQDLRSEIRKHKTLVSEVRKLPEVRFTYSQKPTDNRKNPVDFIHFFIRKGAHVAMYGLLGLSLVGALWGMGFHDKRRWFIAAIIVITIAGLDEWHQTFVGDRATRTESHSITPTTTLCYNFQDYSKKSRVKGLRCRTRNLYSPAARVVCKRQT